MWRKPAPLALSAFAGATKIDELDQRRFVEGNSLFD